VTGVAAAPDMLLDLALGQARALVGRAATVALSLAEIGIDLPEPASAATDPALLQAIAGLYLVSEIDRAGLIEAAEQLAGLSASGRDYGEAGADIAAFWKQRRDRLSGEERRAVFAALFGPPEDEAASGPANSQFFDAMLELAEALYKLDELSRGDPTGGIAQQARLRRAARTLVEGLVSAAGALTLFIAEDLLATTRAALAIFRHADVLAALGARQPWDAVATVRRLNRKPQRPAALHLERGRAGMALLAWVAQAAPHLDDSGPPLVGLDNPVIAAAISWLEASLGIADAVSGPAAPRGSTGGGWARLVQSDGEPATAGG
jgi:hypothetical protein